MNLLLLALTYLSGLCTMGIGLYVAFMPFGDSTAATGMLCLGIAVMVIAGICTKSQVGALGHAVTVNEKRHSVARPAAATGPRFGFRKSSDAEEQVGRRKAPTANTSRQPSTPRPRRPGAMST